MAHEPGRDPAYRRSREREPVYVERRRPGFLRRVVGALFATALGVLAFIGLLVIAAIVVIVVLI